MEKKQQGNILAIVIMFFLFAMISFVTGFQNPFGVIVKQQFAASNFMSQLGNAANFIAYAFMGLPAGMILSKKGYKFTALAAVTVLTAYIPMLTDAGGNAGSQSTSTIIRSMAVGDIAPHDLPRIIWRECRVALMCGVTLAVCNFFKMLLLDRIAAPVALVVCLTLICTILLSQLIGGILPVVAEKFKIDPAVMASPLITTIVDTTTLLIYFNVAKMVLHI